MESTYSNADICICVCMYVCVCMCMYVCMYVYAYSGKRIAAKYYTKAFAKLKQQKDFEMKLFKKTANKSRVDGMVCMYMYVCSYDCVYEICETSYTMYVRTPFTLTYFIMCMYVCMCVCTCMCR